MHFLRKFPGYKTARDTISLHIAHMPVVPNIPLSPHAEETITKANTKVPLAVHVPALGLCGLVASALVAPFVGIIDAAIVRNASKQTGLLTGVRTGFSDFVAKPLQFVKRPTFLLTWGVFAGTYIAANSVDTYYQHHNKDPTYPKFLTTASVNVALNLYRDKMFALMLTGSPPHPMPRLSYLCFGTRDSLTMISSFIFPKIVSEKMSANGIPPLYAGILAQLLTPCAAQIFSTPLHLFGIDYYNNKNRSASDRLNFMKRQYFPTLSARALRIFPAFGIGGLCNRSFVEKTDEYLVNHFQKIQPKSEGNSQLSKENSFFKKFFFPLA